MLALVLPSQQHQPSAETPPPPTATTRPSPTTTTGLSSCQACRTIWPNTIKPGSTRTPDVSLVTKDVLAPYAPQ